MRKNLLATLRDQAVYKNNMRLPFMYYPGYVPVIAGIHFIVQQSRRHTYERTDTEQMKL